MGKIIKSFYTSNDQTWRTPLKLFQELDREFTFDTDCLHQMRQLYANIIIQQTTVLLLTHGAM